MSDSWRKSRVEPPPGKDHVDRPRHRKFRRSDTRLHEHFRTLLPQNVPVPMRPGSRDSSPGQARPAASTNVARSDQASHRGHVRPEPLSWVRNPLLEPESKPARNPRKQRHQGPARGRDPRRWHNPGAGRRQPGQGVTGLISDSSSRWFRLASDPWLESLYSRPQ